MWPRHVLPLVLATLVGVGIAACSSSSLSKKGPDSATSTGGTIGSEGTLGVDGAKDTDGAKTVDAASNDIDAPDAGSSPDLRGPMTVDGATGLDGSLDAGGTMKADGAMSAIDAPDAGRVPDLGGLMTVDSATGVGGLLDTGGTMKVDGAIDVVDAPSGGGVGGASGTDGNLDAGVTDSGSSVVISGVTTSGSPYDIIGPAPYTDLRVVVGSGEMVNFYSVASARTLRSFSVYMTGVSSRIGCVVFESAAEDGTYQPLGSFQSSGSNGLGYVECSARTFSLKAGYFYAIGVFFSDNSTFYYHSTPVAFPIATSFGALISAATRSLALGGAAPLPWSSSTWLYFPQILVTSPEATSITPNSDCSVTTNVSGATCSVAGSLYCGEFCCPSTNPYFCSATQKCYSTSNAAVSACGAVACAKCVTPS